MRRQGIQWIPIYPLFELKFRVYLLVIHLPVSIATSANRFHSLTPLILLFVIYMWIVLSSMLSDLKDFPIFSIRI